MKSRLEEAVERINGYLTSLTFPFPFNDTDLITDEEKTEEVHPKYSSWHRSFRGLPIQGQFVLFRNVMEVELKNFTHVNDTIDDLHTNTLFSTFPEVIISTDTQLKKGKLFSNKHKKRSSSDDVLVIYNQEIVKAFEKVWDSQQPSKRYSSSKISMYILAILNSSVFIDLLGNIKVIEEFKITKQDSNEKNLRGYGCLDYLIRPANNEGYYIVINVQPSTPEKEGLGVTIIQMLSVKGYFQNATHVLGICSDGEKWIFIDLQDKNYIEYIEKKRTT